MVDATANRQTEPYDEWARPVTETDGSGGPATKDNSAEQASFRLEIVLVAGREGEKLQAIQARAIRDALLWAAHREDNDANNGEGENDDRNY